MNAVPEQPRIYHITHINNLLSIIQAGGLLSDTRILAQGGPQVSIGMNTIKQRRMSLPVKCHPGTCVGEYVPFYFCPRSIMLYVIHCGNNPALQYRDGQESIVHLEADLATVVQWANSAGTRWAFSLSNAGARYTEFRNRLDQLYEIDWEAVAATDFRDPAVKEGKQAEFLVHQFVPWHLVQRIGVCTIDILNRAQAILRNARHQPVVEVMRQWYF